MSLENKTIKELEELLEEIEDIIFNTKRDRFDVQAELAKKRKE